MIARLTIARPVFVDIIESAIQASGLNLDDAVAVRRTSATGDRFAAGAAHAGAAHTGWLDKGPLVGCPLTQAGCWGEFGTRDPGEARRAFWPIYDRLIAEHAGFDFQGIVEVRAIPGRDRRRK